MKRLQVIPLILFFAAAVPVTAHAKKVALEWKPMRGAAKYEILVEKDGKPVVQKTLEKPSWSGDLGFGVHAYQIRAIDLMKRAGQWSEPKPLVVMPARSPEIVSPRGGASVGIYGEAASVLLRWNPVEGVSRYRVEVRKKSRVVLSEVVEGTSFDLKGASPGEFSWKVSAVLQPAAADRLPADVRSKHWDSAASRAEDFETERKTLGAAALVEPVGTLPPPPAGKLLFKWRKVEGAEGYEVRVRTVKPRKPAAAAEAAEKTLVVNETSAELPVAAEGRYQWEVRPLANTDSHGAAGAIGPKSAADFDLNRNAKFAEGTGYIAVSTLISPYNYRIVSPASGFNGTTDSLALAMRLSAEYFPKPQWGLGTAVENTSFKILGTSYNRAGFELTGRYRLKLDDAQNGWLFYPKAGFEGRQYFEIYPDTSVAVSSTGTTTAVKAISMVTAGPMAGFDLRKQFSDKFSLGLKFSYFMPLTVLSGGDVQAISSGGASARNLSVGLQGLYWMGPKWALGMGGYFDNRSLAFTRKGATATKPEEIYMDASYFFGSLIYTFGK